MITNGQTSVISASDATSVPSEPKQSNTGAIAGGTVGGVVVLAVLAVITWCCISRRAKEKASANAHAASSQPLQPYGEGEYKEPIHHESKGLYEVNGQTILAEADGTVPRLELEGNRPGR